MAIWTKQKLGDITTKIGSGATPRGGKDSYGESGTPLIRSLNIYDLKFYYNNLAYINETQAKKLNNVTVEKDDVLLNITGASVCRCTSVPDHLVPARVNQHVAIIRADKKGLIGKYLKYVLVSSPYKRELLGLARTGATREALTKTDIENFQFSLPDLPTQIHIASVLSAYDDLIENNEKRIKALEEIAQLLYTEWFVKFKFPGHEKMKMVDSGTEYGMVPEGWEVKTFGDTFDVKYGKTLPTSKISGTGEYKVYGAGGIIGYYGKKNVDTKTPLITCRGNGSGTVWRTFGEGFITNNSFTVQSKNKKIAFEFIYSCLKGCNISASISGSAQPQITIESINFVKYILPPVEIVETFVKKAKPLYELSDDLLKQNQNLSKTRDLLIPQLVTGRRELKQ